MWANSAGAAPLVTSQSVQRHPITDYRSWLLIALTVWALITGGLTAWAWYLAAQRPDVILSAMVVESGNALCLGETLKYRFTLTVSGAAPIDLYTSEIRLDTNEYVSETRLQHFEFDSATQMQITRNWRLPPVYADPVSGLGVRWPPGDYIQRVSAGVVGRSALETIEAPFTVRADCAPGH